MAMFDYREITNSIQNYRKLSNDFDTLKINFQSIQKKINGDTYWSGEAADYYKTEINKLFKDLDDISVAMKNIPNYISRIEENHKKIDSL